MSGRAQAEPVAIIADDEELGRLLLAESAAASGLKALAFDNGTAVLEAALSQDVAIVLLDVDMPGMDGYSVCARLRAEPRLAGVPIVMVTGHEDAAAIDSAFEAGATDFISKPVNWALLPRRIEYILRNAAATRALAEHVAQVRTLVEAIPDTLWVVAPDGNIRWSPNGPPQEDGAALAPPERLHEVLAAIRQTAQDGLQRQLEYREEGAAAERRSFEFRFNRREGGDVVVVRQDTSERTAAAEHIEQLAYFDQLTGLPNRQRCIETAERLFGEAAAIATESVAVIYHRPQQLQARQRLIRP
jgi:PleD family two-component response regulator